MNDKINAALHSISLLAVLGVVVLYFIGDSTFTLLLTYLIVTIALIEVLSLILIGKNYPESYVQTKIGAIVGLLILLGIRSMYPSIFVPLTVTLLAINFFYNFYAINKRKKGAYKRRQGKKLQF
jgi:nicotinamide riboside transporter PnuC